MAIYLGGQEVDILIPFKVLDYSEMTDVDLILYSGGFDTITSRDIVNILAIGDYNI